MNTILKMKQIMEKMNNKKDDPRANLLLSLKPYLKPSRKENCEEVAREVYRQACELESLIQKYKKKN